MASESMKNMRPANLKQAAMQLMHIRPEEMAEIGEKMANAIPEEIASIRARADALMTYELNGAELLKREGHELYRQGKFRDALQKYLRAKNNLEDIPSSMGKMLMLACSLDLMSCYLKTSNYYECIKEGSENVKTLYSRDQIYKGLGRVEDAISDLRKAHRVSLDDDTIAEVLRSAEVMFSKGGCVTRGVVIEEIAEDVETVSSSVKPENDPANRFEEREPAFRNAGESQADLGTSCPTTSSECLNALKDDPESIRWLM